MIQHRLFRSTFHFHFHPSVLLSCLLLVLHCFHKLDANGVVFVAFDFFDCSCKWGTFSNSKWHLACRNNVKIHRTCADFGLSKYKQHCSQVQCFMSCDPLLMSNSDFFWGGGSKCFERPSGFQTDAEPKKMQPCTVFKVKVGKTAFCICYTHHDRSDTFLNQRVRPLAFFQGTCTDCIWVSVLIRRM